MQWYCERCAAYCQAEYRYMLSLQLEDHTGKEWVTAFQVSCNPLRSLCCPCFHVWAVTLPYILRLRTAGSGLSTGEQAQVLSTCPGNHLPLFPIAEASLLMLRTRPRRW